MTSTTNGNGSGVAPVAELVVVHVRDAINPTLAGRGDASYQSPPQAREDALNLVRLLLGRNEAPQCQRASLDLPDRRRPADGHARRPHPTAPSPLPAAEPRASRRPTALPPVG